MNRFTGNSADCRYQRPHVDLGVSTGGHSSRSILRTTMGSAELGRLRQFEKENKELKKPATR
jgi:hypothetical protein